MPEPKKPARAPAAAAPPPASSRAPDPGGQLEELNDQLARFLQHADQLVEEWARFGADVRRTVDGEVTRIDQAVAEASERAIRDAGAQVDRVAADRIEKTVEHAVARWRGVDPDRVAAKVASGGGGTSAAGAGAASSLRTVMIAVVLADLLLVVLVVMTLGRGGSKGSPAPAPGASRGVTVIAPEVLAACDALAAGEWSPDDAALVLRAGTAVCGADEAKVTTTVTERFQASPPPVDAGVVDATPPIDAKKRPK